MTVSKFLENLTQGKKALKKHIYVLYGILFSTWIAFIIYAVYTHFLTNQKSCMGITDDWQPYNAEGPGNANITGKLAIGSGTSNALLERFRTFYFQ